MFQLGTQYTSALVCAADKAAMITSGGTAVPPGISVLWAERQERLIFIIEVSDPGDPQLQADDSGLVILAITDKKGARQQVKLELLHRIDSASLRWSASGRGVSAEVMKMAVGRWGCLVKGIPPANVKVDWSQFVDEDEEAETRRDPRGHDVHKMRGAMGNDWGSNLARTIAARKQSENVNTYVDGDEDDDITLF
uniref:CS domain-containing protein n=1 Tax=Chrysotila carterae TaxID=13221 RepID=A0A7S4B0G7_CHRCT|mmetsp:Transcript_33039/g.72612  ORF Transcript_33039/g.72612 Transcript_33039/m.72612 type:complete len:195 (-) Transcript_33039:199-783(-)